MLLTLWQVYKQKSPRESRQRYCKTQVLENFTLRSEVPAIDVD